MDFIVIYELILLTTYKTLWNYQSLFLNLQHSTTLKTQGNSMHHSWYLFSILHSGKQTPASMSLLYDMHFPGQSACHLSFKLKLDI